MQYGNLRSLYSPTGKEYVTRWNPLAGALLGAQSQDMLGSPPSSAPRAGEFGSGRSSGSGSGGVGDTEAQNGERGPSDMTQGGLGAMPGGFSLAGLAPSQGSIGNAIGSTIGSFAGGPLGGIAGGMLGGTTAGQSVGRAGGSAVGGVLGGLLGGPLGGLAGSFIGGNLGGAAFGDGISDPFGGAANTASPYGGSDPESGNDGLAGYGPGAFGDSAGAGVSSDGSSSEAGSSSSSVGDGGASAGGFYSRGGKVNAAHLMGPNPPGPDDGFGGLDHGEFVLRAAAAEKLGPEILDRLNSGKFKRAALAKALLGK